MEVEGKGGVSQGDRDWAREGERGWPAQALTAPVSRPSAHKRQWESGRQAALDELG